MRLFRRSLLLAGATLAAPAIVRAAVEPIALGILTPFTGAGSVDGPRMARAIGVVGERVNAAGGVLGRPVRFVVEDDQTNPEGAVRAARKLVDVDRVPAILGTWASAVTGAVAPVCWESRVMLFTCSGADSITQLPHGGYIARTQPNTQLQGSKHAELMAGIGAKRVFILSLQSPFAAPTEARVRAVLPEHGAALVGSLVYDKDKSSYRSEVDAALRTKPDMIYLNGYAPDVSVLLRELFRAGYEGGRFAQSYAVNDASVAALPKDVVEGTYTVQPSADLQSPAFGQAREMLGHDPDGFEAQAIDWMSLVALAAARAGSADGPALHDALRLVSQGDGEKVYSATEGLGRLAAGAQVNYEGVSGPCDFTPSGDIADCRFRLGQVRDGKVATVRVV